MEGCALVTLEHPRGGALPAVGGGGRADLRQHRVADPRLRWNTLDGEDLGESRGTGYAHLVVLRVIQDERAPLDAGHEQRRAGGAGPPPPGRGPSAPPPPPPGDAGPPPPGEAADP